MTNLTIVVASLWNYAPLLRRCVQHGQWGCHSSRHDNLIRWWIGSQLMMMLLLWVAMWSINHLVLVRSTVEWGCQDFLLLAFLVSSDGIIRDDGVAH
jgi:hypothetical protein